MEVDSRDPADSQPVLIPTGLGVAMATAFEPADPGMESHRLRDSGALYATTRWLFERFWRKLLWRARRSGYWVRRQESVPTNSGRRL